jgi:ADP-ribose pyrophosphatase
MIPPNAKRVFKGVIFEVWQWEQKMLDGSTKTFEKVIRPATVEIIAAAGDKILLEHQDQPNKKGYINLPSGRADQSDDMLAEAKRELLEETGYASDDWSPFAKYGGDGKVVHEVYYFIARNCKKIKEPQLDAGERITTQLITFDELLALTDEPRFWTSPEFVNALLRARFDPQKKEDLRKSIFAT